MMRLTHIIAAAIVATAVALGPGCLAPTNGGGEAPAPKDPSSNQPETRNSTVTENEPTKTVVIIETSMGTMKAELWPDKAPVTVKNFLTYTDEKFFDGLIFHRVIKDFMVQGGGFDADMKQKAVHDPITNEATADKPNNRGTLAMARTTVVDSATAQFFINLKNNDFLNHSSDSAEGFGYCAFGELIEGLDVLDKISAVATGRVGMYDDVPTTPVTITSIRRAE